MMPSRRDLLRFHQLAVADRRRIRRADSWRRHGATAGAMAREAEAVARQLKVAGLASGDPVALHMDDGPLWHAGFWGVLLAGGIAVPLDTSFDRSTLERAFSDLEIAIWCTDRESPALDPGPAPIVLEHVRRRGSRRAAFGPLPADDPSRIAEVVLTSGTTGAPAAVSVSHANLCSVLDALAAQIDRYRWALRPLPRIRIAVALPLSHLYGQTMGVFVPAMLGADAIHLPPLPARDLARALRDEGAWILATVPRTLELLAEYLTALGESMWGTRGMGERVERALSEPWYRRPFTFAALRRSIGHRLIAVVSGGAAISPEVERFWRACGTVVIQGYGLTETASLVTLNHPFDTAPGSLGRPLPGVELRIAEDGEILVRGPNVVAAAGRATIDDAGWLHTGDLGRLDAAGRLRFEGRSDDRIVTPAGVNVDPGPIAAELRKVRGVLDAVVIERPWGSGGVLLAVLAVEPGVNPDTVVSAVNRGRGDVDRIRSWFVWPEADLPRTRTGKPRRAEIAGRVRGLAPGEADATLPMARPSGAESVDAITRLVAEIGGLRADLIRPETRLADVLGSLDRVALATRIELAYGSIPPQVAFEPEAVVGDLSAGLPTRSAAPAGTQAEPPPGAVPGRADVASATGGVPPARWRYALPVIAFRAAFREGVLRPLWHGLFDLRVVGVERVVDLEPPFLLAPNHNSIIDPGLVMFALPGRLRRRVAPAPLWEHFSRRRSGRLQYAVGVATLNLIPLLQSGDWRPTLRIAGRVVDRDGCPIVYPEGERSPSGRLLRFHPGVAVMARELQLPIMPVGTAGLHTVLPRGARVPRLGRRRPVVATVFGRPIPAPGRDDPIEPIVEELRVRVENLLAEATAITGRV